MIPNGQKIFVGGYGSIHIWDWQAKTIQSRKLQDYLKYINLFAISPDKQLIIGGDNKLLKLWDWQTGNMKNIFQEYTLKNKTEIIYLDDQIIIFRHYNSKVITVQNWYTGENFGNIYENRYVSKVAISLDRKTLVTYGNHINIWNLPTGELKYTIEDDNIHRFSDLSISSDGQTLVTGDAIIKVWDLHTGKIQKKLGRKKFDNKQYHSVYYLTISPDGDTLITASSDSTLKVWNLHTGELQYILEGYSRKIDYIVFSPDGQIIVTSSDRTIKVWGMPFQYH
ncbi:PD40 domain-containing protein [Nostoc sp. FACHB-152]|uniref:WD40 repeat domain-containing protein n=1 Tax=unclassified Nostoc TaxID=2593658 RepID=UPI001686D59E|nr:MULTISPECIES: PD40 domain-containing protein [unclassified Nostoc]MBD2452005.1 PD40 domain-containing protein [Nostoc sp. FACHB-152]MBD2472993.1 PD40 domain-containing protein [Nostoc sp. FACHB-145]